MMDQSLKGKKVAIISEHGVEQSELTEPRKALEQAGARAELVSPVEGSVKAWRHGQWGGEFRVDIPLDQARPENYDALVIPGGVMNPDRLRQNPQAVSFVRRFFDERKPVGAICHGPWMLVEADVVSGRRVTSWPSLRTDLRNAGADWVDEAAVVDGNLVTSRKPDDIPAFSQALIDLIKAAARGARAAA